MMCVCVRTQVHVCHGTCVVVRGQLLGDVLFYHLEVSVNQTQVVRPNPQSSPLTPTHVVAHTCPQTYTQTHIQMNVILNILKHRDEHKT